MEKSLQLKDYIDKIENIIKDKKWVKNNISLGRIQCSKLIRKNENLEIIIASDGLEKPIYTMIEKILINNNEIFLFFNGQYPNTLEKDEYNDYNEFFQKEEWEKLFSKHFVSYLMDKNLIREDEGYYIALHDKLADYEKVGYNKKLTEELCGKYIYSYKK